MSAADEHLERDVLVRSYEATLSVGDGRTLDIRLAPYNVPATVADPPTFSPYQEMFLPGAFERQLSAPDRVSVWLNFEHEQGLRGIVGHGLELRDSPGSIDGSFRVHSNADGDKALQLVNDGLVTGASMEFAALRSRRVGGVVQRLRAHIDRVSLCRSPAYSAAGVLAVREAPDPPEDDDQGDPGDEQPTAAERFERSTDVDDRLARLGIVPLQGLSVTDAPWDASRERFTDEQFAASALLTRDDRPLLPVLEPDGTINRHALADAAVALVGLGGGGLVHVSRSQRASAARQLSRYYHRAGMQVPASLRNLAAAG